ncbi:MAG TPA: septum formation initiator family protein [Candidatus Saccharimonadales bacterium]|nr:septum formation initiator family protein [Candidatus Saccharimonadales bacterium]
MLQKIKNYLQDIDKWTEQLQDVRVLGLLVFAIVVLLISWSGVRAIDANYALQKQISTLKQQNQVQELANNNLKLQNQYFTTNQYLELTARQNFGLAMPGEKELIMPPSVAIANTVDYRNPEDVEADKTAAKQPAYQRHFQAWMNFFLHRQQLQ